MHVFWRSSLGCYIGKVVNLQKGPLSVLSFKVPVDRYINITIAIAALSIAARAYDRFILRGFTIEETFFESRDTLGASVSFFGYLGGPCFTFGFFALALIWLSSSQRRRPVAFAAACLLSTYPMLEGLLQGSRSPILHTAFVVFFFARATQALPWLVRSRVKLTIALLALLVLFQIVFETRSLAVTGSEETISDIYRPSGHGRLRRRAGLDDQHHHRDKRQRDSRGPS